jgi:hypothetical protein
MTQHRPRSAAQARAASLGRAAEEARKTELERLRDLIAPGGRIEVDGVVWRVSVSLTDETWVRVDGQVEAAPIRVWTAAPREGRSLGPLASELREELVEHITMAHDRVVRIGARIVTARAYPQVDEEDAYDAA